MARGAWTNPRVPSKLPVVVSGCPWVSLTFIGRACCSQRASLVRKGGWTLLSSSVLWRLKWAVSVLLGPAGCLVEEPKPPAGRALLMRAVP
jgi:hypothetical protein